MSALLGTFGEIILREGYELPTLFGDEIDCRRGYGGGGAYSLSRGGVDRGEGEGRRRGNRKDSNCERNNVARHDAAVLSCFGLNYYLGSEAGMLLVLLNRILFILLITNKLLTPIVPSQQFVARSGCLLPA